MPKPSSESFKKRFPVFCHFALIILFHCYLDMFPSHSFDSGDQDNRVEAVFRRDKKFLRMTAIRKDFTGSVCPHLVWLDGGFLGILLFIPPTLFEFIICVKGQSPRQNVTVLTLNHILKWIQMNEQSNITLLTSLPSSLFCSNRIP